MALLRETVGEILAEQVIHHAFEILKETLCLLYGTDDDSSESRVVWSQIVAHAGRKSTL